MKQTLNMRRQLAINFR